MIGEAHLSNSAIPENVLSLITSSNRLASHRMRAGLANATIFLLTVEALRGMISLLYIRSTIIPPLKRHKESGDASRRNQ